MRRFCWAAVVASVARETPSPKPNFDIDAFPVVWLALAGGVAVAALILYFVHIRRL
jgi:hypothetical protein